MILDPFSGSSTTGIAANICGRRFLGIEKEIEFVDMSKQRRLELDNIDVLNNYKSKLSDLKFCKDDAVAEPFVDYGEDLPF